MAGWIKLHRKMLSCPIFDNEKCLKVWVWCLLKATHKEHPQQIGRQTVILQPGQFPFGRKKAAEELNMSASTVWSYMKLLESDKRVDIKSNNKFSIVTVTNWGLYQSQDDDNDSKVNNKRTTNGQQKNTNKNGNNVKNEKNIYTLSLEGQAVFDYWNQQKIIVHKEVNKETFKAINTALKKYSKEQIFTAIQHFSMILKDESYFYKHPWTLEELLKRQKGIPYLLDDGEKWIGYLNFQKAQKQQRNKDRSGSSVPI